MLKANRISLEISGALNPLVRDYLKQNPQLDDFYSFRPSPEGFSKALEEVNYRMLDRNQLKEILLLQSKKVTNTSKASQMNIERLGDPQCFTVTTGHQLCLFTGPLYFIYKIFSTINLAKELNQLFPKCHFVPVYWMAGEDHDFAEINHFRLFGKNLVWETDQSGAVGEFSTKGLESTYEKLAEVLGQSEGVEELKSLFKAAYLSHPSLAEASRYLVNELFGDYGLVTVDGQDKKFKAQFKAQFWKDLKTNQAHDLVSASNTKLQALNYSVQVNPRRINSFYTIKGLRARIEKEGEKYKVIGTELNFSEEELRSELEAHPEHFSPNVVLRPLYQQHILPNLAYVGGPGELAYWLQYRDLFREFQTFYPVLVPRNFVTIFEKPILDKLSKLGFTTETIFHEEKELINALLNRMENKPGLDAHYQSLEALYNEVAATLSKVDKTLESSAKAEMQKALSGLNGLEAKLTRALKQKSETEINQIKNIRQKLFPENEPQERIENFSSFFLKYGREFFEVLSQELQPFDHRQILIVDEPL